MPDHLTKLDEENTKMKKAIEGILRYFTSGNSVPVSQATIKSDCAEVRALREAIDEN